MAEREQHRSGQQPEPGSGARVYRVLARKYRPTTLAGLRGQDVLVRTLRNAVASGRLAQAFLLAGVRGVGKTTTARILARMLNCVGADGEGGVTADPCGACEQCIAIAEDRHVDVLEIDAASHTGIDNMRELLEAARYRPVMGRYKIYVMDEVHMLSNAAFNALLKTLEEPPEHLKFVFATTELRKIPATVLSRCQRFDLRRVDGEELAGYFAEIVAREDGEASPEALALIARAADGSVRDGLSILDQALARGQGKADEVDVREMLGLADRGLIFDLYEAVMAGDIAVALANLEGQHAAGVDPAAVLEDLLAFTHWLARYKAAPAATARTAPEFERERGAAMAARLAVPQLTRAWQLLLKGIEEARWAPDARQAVEMTLVRLAYSADLPTPQEALKAALGGGAAPPMAAAPAGPAAARGGAGRPSREAAPAQTVAQETAPAMAPSSPAAARDGVDDDGRAAPERDGAGNGQAGQRAPMPQSFQALLALAEEHRDGILLAHLRNRVHLVCYAPGRLAFRPGEGAPAGLERDLAAALERWTGQPWQVEVSPSEGAATVAKQEREAQRQRLAAAAAETEVARILEAFPGAEVVAVSNGQDRRDAGSDGEARPAAAPGEGRGR